MSTTSIARYLFLYATLWAHHGIRAQQQQQQQQQGSGCTLCADGSPPTPGASLGGTDCGLINDSVGMTPADSGDCLDIQLQGYAYCGCPTIPDSYCTMCDYEETGYVALPSQFTNLVLPGTTDLKCSDAEFIPRQGGALSCAAVRDAAYYCGCVGADQPANTSSCFLCGADHAGATVNNRLLPPLFTETCAARDREIGTLSECTNIEDDYVQLINVTSYCGCLTDTEVEPIGTCPLCGAGNDMVNPNAFLFGGAIKCRQLETVASYVIDADYCSTLQGEANETCCTMTMPPSAAPSRQRNAGLTTPTLPDNEPVLSNDTARSNATNTLPPTAAPRNTDFSPSSSAMSRCATTVGLVLPLLVIVVDNIVGG
jgi:hypothetical protein